MTTETKLLPCPLCGAHMLPESDGYEHPADDTCPLDSLYIEARHIAAWNTRSALAASIPADPVIRMEA